MRTIGQLLATALVVLLVGAVAGVASAANHTAARQKQDKPAAGKAAKRAGEKTGRHVGAVKAADAAGKTLTVAEKAGEATVTVGQKATIKRGKDTLKLGDLKVGDPVPVRYTRQHSKDVARSIIARAG